MSSDPDTSQQKAANDAIQQEILAGRKFSLAAMIGREGGSFLKGESPVPKLFQAKTEINLFIDQHLVDSSGALKTVLQTLVSTDEAVVSRHLDSPLEALREYLEYATQNSQYLYDLVKRVDFKWGQMYDERPYFQKPGQSPHPDDEYTHESVQRQLTQLLEALTAQ